MTNQEIDRVIFRIERKALVQSVLSFQLNGPGVFVVTFLALFAFVAGSANMGTLLLLILAFCFVASIWLQFQNYKSHRKTAFWKSVRNHGLFDEKLTDNTKLLIDKIISIQAESLGDQLLPMRQAVKLVDAYEHQARQLELVEARLSKLGTTRDALNEKIRQLQALGENHDSGLQSLERTRADFGALQKVADEIHKSCDRLETILNGVRVTAKTRQLHRELDQLSASATPSEPAFETESNEEIERQIGREIETYLRLERETEVHLR